MVYFLNIVIIVLEIIGFAISIRHRRWGILAYYTQLSNMAALIGSVSVLIAGHGTAVSYVGTCFLVLTFLVTLLILVPMGGGFKRLMLSGNGLYHHLLCPVFTVISHIIWGRQSPVWYIPVILTIIYGIVMLILNGQRKYDGPYPFFRVHNQSVSATVLWMAALVGVITLISVVVGKL